METRTNTVKPVTLAAALCLLVACSGIPTSQDYDKSIDFERYRSYSWHPDTEALESRTVDNDPLLNRRIHAAVDEVLGARGYRLAGSDPADFTVNYRDRVQGRVTSEGTTGTVSVGFGSFGRFGGIGLVSGNDVEERDEATLTIDLIDAGSGELAWRGSSTRYVDTTETPEERTERIREHVAAILAKFPPQRSKQD